MSSTGFTAALWESIAIEVVTFAEQNGQVIPFAFIEVLLRKESKIDGVHSIKCRNQLGVVSTGTIDLHDRLNPKITLTTDNGITLTNISDDGRKMKKQFLPRVDLADRKSSF